MTATQKTPIENIKNYLEEAKKVAELPEEETDVLNLDLDDDVIQLIKDLACAWNCTENDVIVATLLAMCHENPKKLATLKNS